MSLWIAVISVALLNAAFKAVGPALLGQHDLPPTLRRLVAILPPVVLAALIVSDVAGGRWADGFDWHLVIGVGAAATSRLFSMPMLAAVLIGVAVTAGLRVMA